MKFRRTVFRRALARPVLYGASIALLIEEWLWTSTARGLARLARFGPVARGERWIGRQSPPLALAILAMPILTLIPFKVLAFVLMYIGHGALGLTVLVIDKLVVTALFARLWQLTEPAITEFRFIRRGRDGFLRLRWRLHAWLERQPAFVEARAIIRRHLDGLRRGRIVAGRVRRRRGDRRVIPLRPRAAPVEVSRDR